MKILILTGRFGMGHYSVARALSERIAVETPNAQCTVVDLFAQAFGGTTGLLYKAYTLFISRGGKIYNQIYRRSENGTEALGIPQRPVFLRALGHVLAERSYDAVISVLPLTSQLVSEYKTRTGDRTPLVTCITDVCPHGDWTAPNTDAYLVAAERTRSMLAARGVPRRNIYVTGVPVRPCFTPSVRRPGDGPREMLLTGGGLGLLPSGIGFYRALNALSGLHTTIVCGDNEALYDKLHGRFENITVLGFVSDMDRLLRESDLVVGKPGGVTLFESIAARVPLLAFRPFLAQETYNAGFMRAEQIGEVLDCDPQDCLEQLRDLIFDDARLLAMRRNMDRLVAARDDLALPLLLARLGESGCRAS